MASVPQQIAEEIATRLTAVTVANGYNVTVSGVVRSPRIWTGHPKDYQVIVTLEDVVRNEELTHPGNPPAVAFDLPVVLTGELRPSESASTPIDDLRHTFAADIIKGISTPAASWHNWGGLAINTAIDDVRPYESDELTGVQVRMTVTYRVSETDPYTVRA